jgi:hypothetical protein
MKSGTKSIGPGADNQLRASGDKYGGKQDMGKAIAHIQKGGKDTVCPNGNPKGGY